MNSGSDAIAAKVGAAANPVEQMRFFFSAIRMLNNERRDSGIASAFVVGWLLCSNSYWAIIADVGACALPAGGVVGAVGGSMAPNG